MRKEVTYVSDQSADYVSEMQKCETLEELRAVLEDYAPLFPDALAACPKDETEFAEFVKGRNKERRGVFAGEEWSNRFIPILIPMEALECSIIADRLHVPWGLVYLRKKESQR